MTTGSAWNGRRVLVTGAGGLLGAALCRRLLDEGAVVAGTVRRRSAPAGVLALPCMLEHGPWLDEVLDAAAPEVVFHLASPIDLGRDAALLDSLWGPIVRASLQLAERCLRQGLRLVHVGTCEEYGAVEAPFAEHQVVRPVCPYGVAKTAATAGVLGLVGRGLRGNVVRPFLTYGPGQGTRGLLGGAVEAAKAGRPFPMTSGGQTRELNFVDDQVEGLLRAAGDEAVGTLLNLGGGQELPVRTLAETVFEVAGRDPGLVRAGELPDRPGERARFCGDHRLATELLGPWRRTPLREGLRRTLEAAATDQELPRVRVEPVVRFDDPRGALLKVLPHPVAGEVYVVTCAPGAVRGEHRHHRMGEWFTALRGAGVVRVEGPGGPEEHSLVGQRVHVPASVGHAVVNTGDEELVVVAFAGRLHDPDDVEPVST